jgi:hypothetical protein
MPSFSLGVNYWPRRSATAMWERFDAGELRDDFAHIRALGLDTVRFFVRWDLAQPHPETVDSGMLDRLAAVVTLLGDAGLRAVPTLFCGYWGGTVWLPTWAVDRGAPGGCGDLYAGPILEAQCRAARAVAERCGDHPAIAAWDIGNAFSNVRRPGRAKLSSGDHSQVPADERRVAAWSRRLAQALTGDGRAGVTAGTDAADLLEERDLRLTSLCAPFAFASIQGDQLSNAFARGRLDCETLPFLAMLTAAYSYKPVLITAFGDPACPATKFSAFERFARAGDPPNATIAPDDPVFATFPCLTDDENAYICTATLERLHADGRIGALWRSWADVGEEFAESPPFDRAPHQRFGGLVRVDGSEKPVAAALSAFAQRRPTVVPAREMPMISSAYYYRTLPTSTVTLYEAYLRFIAERRATGA